MLHHIVCRASAVLYPRPMHWQTKEQSEFPRLSCRRRGPVRTGNREPEFSAVRRTRRSPEPATMCLDNSSTDRQPHAHACGLGREQRIEDAMTDRVFDS